MDSPLSFQVGLRIGKWTALAERRVLYSGRMRKRWRCRCDCGVVRDVDPSALIHRQTMQCRRCSNKEKAAMKPRLIHGQSDTRLHNIWMLMRRRCENEQCEDYPRYGGRNISVCEEWHKFEPFFQWAKANGYAAHLTIDRRDNDGNYEPENCRWVDRTAQNRNRRDNVRHDWRGKRLLLSEIAELEGVSYSILRCRVQGRDWSLARAVAQKPRKSPNRKKANVPSI